jgi:hypothetical protein
MTNPTGRIHKKGDSFGGDFLISEVTEVFLSFREETLLSFIQGK